MEAPAPAQPTVEGPSDFWRQSGGCRRRKAASPNIFQGVNLRQLQCLFRRSGDQRAQQRAELVWEHGDESELAQALIGLRRGRSRRHKTGRGALGPVWLKTFGKMRINEGDTEVDDDYDSEADSSSTDTTIDAQCDALTDREADSEQDSNQQASSPRRRSTGKQETERDPERYLHRILH